MYWKKGHAAVLKPSFPGFFQLPSLIFFYLKVGVWGEVGGGWLFNWIYIIDSFFNYEVFILSYVFSTCQIQIRVDIVFWLRSIWKGLPPMGLQHLDMMKLKN